MSLMSVNLIYLHWKKSVKFFKKKLLTPNPLNFIVYYDVLLQETLSNITRKKGKEKNILLLCYLLEQGLILGYLVL